MHWPGAKSGTGPHILGDIFLKGLNFKDTGPHSLNGFRSR